MKLGLLHRGEYPEAVRLELEQIIASITTSIGKEHGAEGVHRRVYGRWRMPANQSLTNGTDTRIVVTVPDEGTSPSLTISNGIVTIGTPGLYLLNGQIRYATGGAAGQRAAALRILSVKVAFQLMDVAAGVNGWVNLSACRPCVTGDTIELWGYQASGGAINAESSETFLSVTRVSG